MDHKLIPKSVRRLAPYRLRKLFFNRPLNTQHRMIDEKKVLNAIEGNAILDCGCGLGRWGYLLRKTYKKKVAGIDLNKKHLLHLRKKYYVHLVQADIAHLPFVPKCFDTVLAIEVIEHQIKEDGARFLNYIDQIAIRKIILSTPLGFYDTGLSDLEAHKSGWTDTELESYGYKTEIFSFLDKKWIFAVRNIQSPIGISYLSEICL